MCEQIRESEPFEALHLPQLAYSQMKRFAFTQLVIAVQGSCYASDTVEGMAYALRYLRDNPDVAEILLARD